MGKLYAGSSTLTGELTTNKKVTFRTLLTQSDRSTLLLFLILIVLTTASLVWFMLSSFVVTKFNLVLVIAITLTIIVEIIRLLQSLTLLIFAMNAKDPVPMIPASGLRIAVLTTIVPGKEPFDIIARTLMAMKRMQTGEGNTVDVWLLDEGNDSLIKTWCLAMGIKHFSRKGLEQYNQASGSFKAKTKHGNHNAWRNENEANYDIVAQMDPDHLPEPDFLMRTLGYFTDERVGFVVAPQVYGNLKENWIARASAFQAYLFHGIIQRGGNGLGAPLLIGTNHLYRTIAFKSINGYQDSIIEDHLTSMVIYSKEKTQEPWIGVYTPDVIAVGEGPTSFTDYFNQQKRWAYGIWDIAMKSTPKALRTMSRRQGLTFLMLQFFYPSVAVSWVMSSITTILFSSMVTSYLGIGPFTLALWAISCASSMGLFFWLRKFNLMPHEKKDWGFEGMALLLMCIPVYVSAAWQALTRKPLTYAVTAKGSLTSPDTLSTFAPHLYWIVVNLVAMGLMFTFSPVIVTSSAVWMVEHIAICILPISIFAFSKVPSYFRTVRTQLSSLRPAVKVSSTALIEGEA